MAKIRVILYYDVEMEEADEERMIDELTWEDPVFSVSGAPVPETSQVLTEFFIEDADGNQR